MAATTCSRHSRNSCLNFVRLGVGSWKKEAAGGYHVGMAMHGEFLKLIIAHQDDLRAFLASLVRNGHDREDVFQETVLTLWDKFDEYDRSRAFGAWAKGASPSIRCFSIGVVRARCPRPSHRRSSRRLPTHSNGRRQWVSMPSTLWKSAWNRWSLEVSRQPREKGGAPPSAILRLTTFAVKDYEVMVPAERIPENQWVHLAVVCDRDNTAHFYLNGKHYRSIAADKPGNSGPVWLEIGGGTIRNDELWHGRLAHLAVYGRRGNRRREVCNPRHRRTVHGQVPRRDHRLASQQQESHRPIHGQARRRL